MASQLRNSFGRGPHSTECEPAGDPATSRRMTPTMARLQIAWQYNAKQSEEDMHQHTRRRFLQTLTIAGSAAALPERLAAQASIPDTITPGIGPYPDSWLPGRRSLALCGPCQRPAHACARGGIRDSGPAGAGLAAWLSGTGLQLAQCHDAAGRCGLSRDPCPTCGATAAPPAGAAITTPT